MNFDSENKIFVPISLNPKRDDQPMSLTEPDEIVYDTGRNTEC